MTKDIENTVVYIVSHDVMVDVKSGIERLTKPVQAAHASISESLGRAETDNGLTPRTTN